MLTNQGEHAAQHVLVRGEAQRVQGVTDGRAAGVLAEHDAPRATQGARRKRFVGGRVAQQARDVNTRLVGERGFSHDGFAGRDGAPGGGRHRIRQLREGRQADAGRVVGKLGERGHDLFQRRGYVGAQGVVSRPIGVGEQADPDEPFSKPGRYYLAVKLDDSDDKARYEATGGKPYTSELAVEVLGRRR